MLVSEFITAVRRQGKITTDTTDPEILATGDMEIQGRLIPLLRLTRQEYFVAETQTASSFGRVALPPRSVLGSVRHVQLVVNGRAIALPRLELEDDGLSGAGGLPAGWYFDGAGVVLLPRGTDGTVRIRYFLRPGKMVLESDTVSCAQITAASVAATGIYTLTTTSALGAGQLCDIVSAGGGHATVAADFLGSATTAGSVPSASVLAPISVGDYEAKVGFSPFVPVPEELFAALVHQTAYVILRSLGYDDEAAAQKVLASESLHEGQMLLAPRAEGNPRRRRGGIRASTGRWGGSYGWRK